MKSIIAIGLVCAMCITVPPKAEAINEEWSAVAGFVGGVLFHAAVQNTQPIVHEQTVQYRRQPVAPCNVRPTYHQSQGYWETVQYRDWVPGYWLTTYDRCGRARKRYINGHWNYWTENVWVETR